MLRYETLLGSRPHGILSQILIVLYKEETSLFLYFIFQFVSKYWQSCTACSMEKLYSEYHSLRNVKLQGGSLGGFPGGYPSGSLGGSQGGSQGIASR